MNSLLSSRNFSGADAGALSDWQNRRETKPLAHNPFENKQTELRARDVRIQEYIRNPRQALFEIQWLTPICGLTPMPECDECGFQDDENGSLLPCDGRNVIKLDAQGLFQAEERTYGECPYCRRGTMIHLPFATPEVIALRRKCLAWIQESKSREPINTVTGFEATLKAAIRQGCGLRSVEWEAGTHLRIDGEGRLRLITPEGESSPHLLTAESVLHRWQLV